MDEVLASLEEIRTKYGPDLRIDLDIVEEDYSDGHRIEVTVQRVETDQECKSREAKEEAELQAKDKAQEIKLKEMYDMLKKRFEGK